MSIKKFRLKKKLQEVKIMCVPAHIRHCDGFVIETLTSQPERKIIFELLGELKEKHGYNVYTLLHTETDWTEPKYVSMHSSLINRFGWFLTKDKMVFSSKQQDVKLRKTNTVYFNVTDENYSVEESYIGRCKEIDVLDYLLNTKN